MSELIGCIAVCPTIWGTRQLYPVKAFMGLNCPKGRGFILPGGRWEPEKDPTYQHCAARELKEEIGLIADPNQMEYLWHGPDGYGYTTFAFLAYNWDYNDNNNLSQPESEPIKVTKEDLLTNHFKAWYKILFEVCKSKL